MQFPEQATRIRMNFPTPPFAMAGPVEFDAECKPLQRHRRKKKKPAKKG